MLEAIEKLLTLQDRDRKITQLQVELNSLGPQRHSLQARVTSARTHQDALRDRLRHLESNRKRLELEVEARKAQIERYSLQQFQTKKNEEYRALTHEIDNCKAEITKLEDQQLELMEQAEATQRSLAEVSQHAQEVQHQADRQLADLTEREAYLRKYLAELQGGREQLAAAVDGGMLPRYERLRRSKGERVVVGIEHGVCGGCHMKLPPQVLVACQSEQAVNCCPNCGRILYWTRDMNLVVSE
ncbi:MAG: hypothetical protein FJ387_07600 [Verrucomicrobia bacterium]|nr:hypothetical protein [Verrucomicrobiota bacterium]